MPGVVAVITGRDLAADNIGGIAPVAYLNGRDGEADVSCHDARTRR